MTFPGPALLVLPLALFSPAPPAQADTPPPIRDRVSFSVDATREVANDWIRATVGVTEEGPDAAALANRINQTMAWALERAKAKAGVLVQSGAYHTSPVYDQGRIRRWRASQDLVLEGRDLVALTELLGTLQERLLLRGIAFSVSDERRREVEAELIREALAAYGARAELVRESLARKGYGLVDLQIQTGGARPPRPLQQMRTMAAEVAAPSFEEGTSTLTVGVSATIELE